MPAAVEKALEEWLLGNGTTHHQISHGLHMQCRLCLYMTDSLLSRLQRSSR